MEAINFSNIQFKEENLNQTNSIIVIKIKDNRKGSIAYTPISIDRCCKSFTVEPNISNISSIKDTIPRASCNMRKEDFLSKYVQKRKSLILQGCQNEWRARKWTLEGTVPSKFYNLIAQITYFYGHLYKVLYSYSGVLNRYPTNLNITWNTVGKDPFTNDMFFRRTTGADILSLLKNNYTIKVFERLNSSLKRKKMSKRTSYIYKMDIFKDYSYPQPFPLDKFLRLPDGSPNQAYLMLGTKGTGR